MEFMECVCKRRAIRGYKPDAIDGEVLAQLFEAVRLAPSGMNTQPYHFYCVTDALKRAEDSGKSLSSGVCRHSACDFCGHMSKGPVLRHGPCNRKSAARSSRKRGGFLLHRLV